MNIVESSYHFFTKIIIFLGRCRAGAVAWRRHCDEADGSINVDWRG